jgi:nuclear transport factor 2 (NTF2) superfamily protein
LASKTEAGYMLHAFSKWAARVRFQKAARQRAGCHYVARVGEGFDTQSKGFGRERSAGIAMVVLAESGKCLLGRPSGQRRAGRIEQANLLAQIDLAIA